MYLYGCSVWHWYVDNEQVANSIKEVVANKVNKYVNKHIKQSTNSNTTIVEQFAVDVETLAEEAIGDDNNEKAESLQQYILEHKTN